MQSRSVFTGPREGGVAVFQRSRIRCLWREAIVYRNHHNIEIATQRDAGTEFAVQIADDKSTAVDMQYGRHKSR